MLLEEVLIASTAQIIPFSPHSCTYSLWQYFYVLPLSFLPLLFLLAESLFLQKKKKKGEARTLKINQVREDKKL